MQKKAGAGRNQSRSYYTLSESQKARMRLSGPQCEQLHHCQNQSANSPRCFTACKITFNIQNFKPTLNKKLARGQAPHVFFTAFTALFRSSSAASCEGQPPNPQSGPANISLSPNFSLATANLLRMTPSSSTN